MTACPTQLSTHIAPPGRRCAAAVLCAVLVLAAPAALMAQGNSPTAGLIDRPVGRAAPGSPVLPTPDAVPGTRPREPAAPATRVAGDMQPTEALFDAINRGDIASARDALNRGADLNGVNVLGMTPMELSVDLGRNDISFLLLSMRGEDSGRGSRLAARDGRAPSSADKAASSAKPVAKPVATARAAAAAKGSVVVARPVTTPKLFANDGGAPLPSAGFLGFDPHSAAN
jgi:hypothetical protein